MHTHARTQPKATRPTVPRKSLVRRLPTATCSAIGESGAALCSGCCLCVLPGLQSGTCVRTWQHDVRIHPSTPVPGTTRARTCGTPTQPTDYAGTARRTLARSRRHRMKPTRALRGAGRLQHACNIRGGLNKTHTTHPHTGPLPRAGNALLLVWGRVVVRAIV